MKAGICMRLKCVECDVWYNIPENKMDDFNIYRKAQASPDGSLDISYAPCLLCHDCTNKILSAIT